ncbi:MAG: hypothetical protein IJX19_11215 [Clostridia bacterium]|nr:hypothetical protein [Clostridia bacterium]
MTEGVIHPFTTFVERLEQRSRELIFPSIRALTSPGRDVSGSGRKRSHLI